MREQFFADDRPVEIPERIERMTDEELDAEIERLEKKARKEKQRILADKSKRLSRNVRISTAV